MADAPLKRGIGGVLEGLLNEATLFLDGEVCCSEVLV